MTTMTTSTEFRRTITPECVHHLRTALLTEHDETAGLLRSLDEAMTRVERAEGADTPDDQALTFDTLAARLAALLGTPVPPAGFARYLHDQAQGLAYEFRSHLYGLAADGTDLARALAAGVWEAARRMTAGTVPGVDAPDVALTVPQVPEHHTSAITLYPGEAAAIASGEGAPSPERTLTRHPLWEAHGSTMAHETYLHPADLERATEYARYVAASRGNQVLLNAYISDRWGFNTL